MTAATTMPGWAFAALEGNPWADDAARLWPKLHRKTRERVLAAARAELAVSRTWVLAHDAIVRAVKGERRQRDPASRRVRFT